MEIHAMSEYEFSIEDAILPWKKNEHRKLKYVNEPFNDQASIKKWKKQGFDHSKFTGEMYDMRNPIPKWFDISIYEKELGWKELSWSFYKMKTGVILPNHVDTFKRFKELHPDYDPKTIKRAVVLLEDWSPGHVLTVDETQMFQWEAGDFIWFNNDVPHMAANIGTEDRYTLQLTGFDV